MAKKLYPQSLVLDTALELAKEVGFNKLSIRAIAKRLNTSVSPVYDSFESKQDIIQAIIIKVLDENVSNETYFNRNHGILSYGLKYPMLYRDIQMHTRIYPIETTHIQDVRTLMMNESSLNGFSERALNSMNFDILIFISGLVQLKLSDTKNELNDDYHHNTLDQVTELLRLGYKQALKGES